VRLSLVRATSVAGFCSLLAWTTPLVAQGPTIPRQPTAGVPVPVAAPAPSGTSVVVIDIAFIFKNHVRFNARMNEIKTDIEAFEGQIKAEQAALQARSEGLKAFTPSSQEYRNLEGELAKAGADMQVKVGMKRKDFLEREARVYYEVYEEIRLSVMNFCQRNRIELVLRYNSDEMKPDDRASVLQGVNRAVVFQQGRDITTSILQMLNPPGAAVPTATASQQPTGVIARPPAGPVNGGARPAQGGIPR
jgi:Skp family chaperone for outer membrane proteins